MEKNYYKYNKLFSFCQSCWLILALSILPILILPLNSQGGLVDDLNEQIQEQQTKQAELEKKVQEYQQVIDEKRGEIRSLNNEIAIFNAQISKLEIEINITEEGVYQTELEIMQLVYGLEKAEQDMEKNKITLAEIIRTIDQYDQTSDIEIILSSSNFSDFFSQITYIGSLQNKIQITVEDLRYLKNKLAENKVTEEQKKANLEGLKDELISKQNNLNYQKGSRKTLLNQSKGEETTYQKILADIEEQKRSILGDINRLRQLKSAELARLEAELSKPPREYWASTNWFYRQDDPAWSALGIGQTNSSMANYGCAVTVVSMVFTYYGTNINPGQLAKEPIYYYDLIVWPQKWNDVQLSTLTFRTTVDWSKIDREIGAGYPVIVRIQADGRNGGHYVVIHTKTAGGRYVVHDPLFGANIYLDSSRAYISELYDTTTSLNQMIIYH